MVMVPMAAGSSLPSKHTLVKINCGLLGGISQAGLFNPWDRALYLSVKHNRPFLSGLNFINPYQVRRIAIPARKNITILASSLLRFIMISYRPPAVHAKQPAIDSRGPDGGMVVTDVR
jgi:hypothetical protein